MCRFAAPNAASTSTTRLPSVARKIPTFAATRLLPTPPLPLPIATTRGIIEGAHNRGRAGRSSARWPPVQCSRRFTAEAAGSHPRLARPRIFRRRSRATPEPGPLAVGARDRWPPHPRERPAHKNLPLRFVRTARPAPPHPRALRPAGPSVAHARESKLDPMSGFRTSGANQPVIARDSCQMDQVVWRSAMGETDVTFRHLLRDLPQPILRLAFPRNRLVPLGPLDPSVDKPRQRTSDNLFRVRHGAQEAAVHVEVEREWRTEIARRLFEYASSAMVATQLPVWSVVVLLRPGGRPPSGTGVYRIPGIGGDVIQFRYQVVPLWRLDAHRMRMQLGLQGAPFCVAMRGADESFVRTLAEDVLADRT